MGLKKINIGIPENVHKQAKVIAVLKDMTLNEFFTSALEKALDRDLNQLNEYVRGYKKVGKGEERRARGAVRERGRTR